MNVHCRFHSVFDPGCAYCQQVAQCTEIVNRFGTLPGMFLRPPDPIVPGYDRERFLANMARAAQAIADKIESGRADVEAKCAAAVVTDGPVKIAVGILVTETVA